MFYTNQKVVCVEHPAKDEPTHDMPIYNQVYTISNVYTAYDGVLMLELYECPYDGDDDWLPGFEAVGNFRPVCDKKTDISIFEEMLNVRELV